jgi:hypothetical protein
VFLYINFTTKTRDIERFIALLVNLPAIQTLKQIVDGLIKGVERESIGIK